jgi:hypothetical protein
VKGLVQENIAAYFSTVAGKCLAFSVLELTAPTQKIATDFRAE